MAGQTPAVGMERKLAAIFSTDVAGYSRLMGDDEEATIRTLTAYRAVISSLIQQHRGRVVDAPGDNLLAEFASVVDAVRCAVEIQQELKVKNEELPEHRQMQFRVGINLGDVIVEGEPLYGDGVNIAARLESLAIPGGICISGKVFEEVKNKLALRYDDLGPQQVKNIAESVRVFRVVRDAAAIALAEQAVLRQAQHERIPPPGTLNLSQSVLSEARRTGTARHKWRMGAGASLLLVAAVTGVVLYRPFSSFRIPQSPIRIQEAPPPSLPLPDKPSLIVLPFVNMSKDPDQEYFSDGLTEVLTGDLSKISSLFVIARNSAFTYKGKAVKIQDVSKEMGVRYVLEGRVQRAEKQIRIAVQLIDATTSYHMWSEQYDRPLTDIFTLQDEIVQKIATTLKLQLTLQEKGYIVRRHTDNLDAYDAYLRGAESFYRFTKEDNTQARQLFEKAVALDPHYADAYAWLAWVYREELIFGWSTDPQNLERGLAMAQQAIALDDSLPAAHSRLSYVYGQLQNYEQAIAEGERAIALDPNDDDSYATLADVLKFHQPEETIRLMEQAMRLNPRAPWWYPLDLGVAYQLTGRYTEAIAMQKEAISRNPSLPYAHSQLAVDYVLQWLSQQSPADQTLEPAVAEIQQALALNDSWHWSHQTWGALLLVQHQYDQARAEMERSVALAPNEAWSYAALAVVLSCEGRVQEAREAAAQALRLKSQVEDGHLADVGSAYVVAGRPEEAIAPLKRFLARYPKTLLAHVTLAAAYSELGQTAEAQTEAAEVLRLNPNFSLAVHKQRMPIKDSAVLERYIAALRKAGLK